MQPLPNMRFIGFEPLWGNLVERCQENRLLRVLVFPLWLWEAMWYYTRCAGTGCPA